MIKVVEKTFAILEEIVLASPEPLTPGQAAERAGVNRATACRIIRELTLNAIKHGGAKHVKIAGAEEGSVLRFSVRDDGAGFDPDTVPGVTEGHFGLEGIRQRVRSFSGTFDMERTAEGGMRAIVTIPIPSASEGTK